MRIISIGCPVPSPSVDNHSIANAPSIFDYDACIIDPQAVSEQIEGIAASTLAAKSTDGRPVGAGESGAFHFGLGELLLQRQWELTRLMERGGLLVLFLYPNVRHSGVAAFAGLDRYSIIPAPPVDPFRWPTLRPADGKDARPTDPHHPASGLLDDLAGRIRYRAILDLPSESDGTVIGRSIGGAAVAAEFRVGAGRVIALPPPDQLAATQRKHFSASLLEMIERLLEDPDASSAPVWVRRYDTVDGAAARDGLMEAEQALKSAQRRVAEAESMLLDTTRFQRMLWQSQNAAFRDVVEDAFRVLGYGINRTETGLELRNGSDTALVELASATGAVTDRLYLTLQQRIEEQFLRRNARPQGIIVANGFRETDPRIRREPFPRTLINACETFGYALIPAEALYELVCFAVEASDDPEALNDIRQSIADTAGVLEVSQEDEADEANEADEELERADDTEVVPTSAD